MVRTVKRPDFLLLCLWFAIGYARLISHLTWLNPSLTYWFPESDQNHSKIVNLFGIATVVAIVACIFTGPIIDFIGKWIFSSSNLQKFLGHQYLKSEGDQTKGRRIGIAIFAAIECVWAFIYSFLYAQKHTEAQISMHLKQEWSLKTTLNFNLLMPDLNYSRKILQIFPI